MATPFMTNFGNLTLTQLWAEQTLHECLQRVGYTVVWSEQVTGKHGPVPLTEDFILLDPDGNWFATRIGQDGDDGPDLEWRFPHHRTALLHAAFDTGGYGGPCATLNDLVQDVAAGAAPRPDLNLGTDWGAGHILLNALDLLDPEDRAATELLLALSYPNLLPSLSGLRNWVTNRDAPDWDNAAQFVLAQAACGLWPTLLTGLLVLDTRMAPLLLVYPREDWRRHAEDLLTEAAFTAGSATYDVLEAAWAKKGKDPFLFCVSEVKRLTRTVPDEPPKGVSESHAS